MPSSSHTPVRSLRDFLAILRREGEIVEVAAPTDPKLEIAEIHRRVIAAGGPALLFKRPRGSDIPVATNLFGTAIQVFVTGLIPYAFISYFPAVYLFDKETWGLVAWLAPLVALWSVLVARFIFYRGLRRFEGAGN